MKYNERYDLILSEEGILIYDTDMDEYVNPTRPLKYVCHVASELQSYEDNQAEAAWYRSIQDTESQSERSERHHNYQRLK
jgi:hypothetical protein